MAEIRAFLSYADKDRHIAVKFKRAFTRHGVDIFLAYNDIKSGEKWRSTLIREIGERDFFIALVSANYRSGNYTDHECGMAVAHNKTIIPIRVDDTPLYGLIEQYHSTSCSHESIEPCVKKIMDDIVGPDELNIKTANYFINEIHKSDSYETARLFAKQLLQLELFTEDQISRLSTAYLKNQFIRKKQHTRRPILKTLEENYDLIKPELKTKLALKAKKRYKKYARYGGRNKYAVSQDLWKVLDVEIHRPNCTYVPKYPLSSTIKWLFAPTLQMAVDIARGLGKEHGMRYAYCPHCKPPDKIPPANKNVLGACDYDMIVDMPLHKKHIDVKIRDGDDER